MAAAKKEEPKKGTNWLGIAIGAIVALMVIDMLPQVGASIHNSIVGTAQGLATGEVSGSSPYPSPMPYRGRPYGASPPAREIEHQETVLNEFAPVSPGMRYEGRINMPDGSPPRSGCKPLDSATSGGFTTTRWGCP